MIQRATTRCLDLPIDGLHCTSCTPYIEYALQDVDGVIAVRGSLGTQQATLAYGPASVEVPILCRTTKDTRQPLGLSHRRGGDQHALDGCRDGMGSAFVAS